MVILKLINVPFKLKSHIPIKKVKLRQVNQHSKKPISNWKNLIQIFKNRTQIEKTLDFPKYLLTPFTKYSYCCKIFWSLWVSLHIVKWENADFFKHEFDFFNLIFLNLNETFIFECEFLNWNLIFKIRTRYF